MVKELGKAWYYNPWVIIPALSGILITVVIYIVSGWYYEPSVMVPALLGIVATVLMGIISGYIPLVIDKKRNSRLPSQVELVDVILVREFEEYPILEVKLRNTGDVVAFLKRAQFRVLNFWHIPQCGNPSAVPVSWEYDIKLSDANIQNISISQAIKPNSVDRFQFRIATDSIYPVWGLYIYIIEISLFYDGDNKIITSPPILINAGPTATVRGFYQHNHPDCVIKNSLKAKEILRSIEPIENLISSEDTLSAVKSWAEAYNFPE